MKEAKGVIQRIKQIKRALKMPFHAFFRDSELWTFWLENEKGEHLDWTGRTFVNVVNDAMEYVKHELSMGSIEDPDEKKKKVEEKKKPVEEL